MKKRNIKFIGSGDWAFQVLKELANNFNEYQIYWDCRHGYEKKHSRKKEFNFNNVYFLDKYSDLADSYDYIFIISNSLNHVKDFEDHKSLSIPIFIEKPFFTSMENYYKLNEFQRRNIFFNLEFYYAFYIDKLKKCLKNKKIFQLDYIWLDPFLTSKKNYTRNSEIFSSIFQDQLLHILSINKSIGIDCRSMKIDNNESFIKKNIGHQLNLICFNEGINMNFSISRFAEKRERRIIVNKGEIILDFSYEPLLILNNKLPKKIILDNNMMPLPQTIKNFLYYQKLFSSESPLSISSLIPEIKFCFKCENKFVNNISNILDSKENNQKIESSVYYYYLGIMYYRYFIDGKKKLIPKYFKGEKGLAELKKWGKENILKNRKAVDIKKIINNKSKDIDFI